MGFIEEWRDALTRRFDKGSNEYHMSEGLANEKRRSYSGVAGPEKDYRGGAGSYKRPDENKTAYDSLRRGEDVSQEGTTYKGGIYGTRFLGKNPNDFLSPEYFSGNDVSDKYGSNTFIIQDRSSGERSYITVGYDDEGAIAKISTLDGDVIVGPDKISDFFRQLSWDDGRYAVNGYVLGEGNTSTPTYVFGSRGRGTYRHNDGASRRWTLDNTPNKRAFQDYYRQYSK